MTLISDIIRRSFRSLNLIAVGASPTAPQEAEALDLLQTNIRSMFGTSLGQPLDDINYGEENRTYKVDDNSVWRNYFADEVVMPNTRMVLNLSQPLSIPLHDKPSDGARLEVVDAAGNLSVNTLTLEGNGRKIEGNLTRTINTDNASLQWFYRADVADWRLVSDLTTADESPFPLEFDELLILSLAVDLCPLYGVSMTAEQLSELRKTKSRFGSRYSQTKEEPLDPALTYTETYNFRYF